MDQQHESQNSLHGEIFELAYVVMGHMIGRKIKVGFGDLASLWKDFINGLTPFNEQFP